MDGPRSPEVMRSKAKPKIGIECMFVHNRKISKDSTQLVALVGDRIE